jgi:signal transduction histidine kinase
MFRWFAPPDLPRPELRRRARALWIVSWPFFAVVAMVLGIGVLVDPHTLPQRATTIISVGILITLLHAISRAGRPVLASWILVVGLTVIVTQRAWDTGGIHAPVAVFYALFIVMASVLLGARGGQAIAVLCLLGAAVLAVGTAREWLTTRPGAGSPLGAFVFVVLTIGLAVVLQILVTFRSRGEGLAPEALQMFVHDMRSPMQIVVAHLELLRQHIGGEGVKDVEGALGGATTLRRMTDSLLDVSRLDAGRMPVRRSVTDLSSLADSVVRSFRVVQPTRDIAVETVADSACNCDPELTRRIIENLVSNALKHTPLEGRVRVVVAGDRDRAYIAVHDEGPGVATEKHARIFEPYSAETLRSAVGWESSGLGLAFCRLAAKAQDGTIHVENATPRGSVFILALPR